MQYAEDDTIPSSAGLVTPRVEPFTRNINEGKRNPHPANFGAYNLYRQTSSLD